MCKSDVRTVIGTRQENACIDLISKLHCQEDKANH